VVTASSRCSILDRVASIRSILAFSDQTEYSSEDILSSTEFSGGLISACTLRVHLTNTCVYRCCLSFGTLGIGFRLAVQVLHTKFSALFYDENVY
jgi:hypothetical protein